MPSGPGRPGRPGGPRNPIQPRNRSPGLALGSGLAGTLPDPLSLLLHRPMVSSSGTSRQGSLPPAPRLTGEENGCMVGTVAYLGDLRLKLERRTQRFAGDRLPASYDV